MQRLIDANALDFEKLQDTNGKAIPANEYIAFLKGAIAAEEMIKNAPTIDAEPVVHGHWNVERDIAEMQLICNCCGYSYIEADPDCNERHNYCPHCGAKMDEEQG